MAKRGRRRRSQSDLDLSRIEQELDLIPVGSSEFADAEEAQNTNIEALSAQWARMEQSIEDKINSLSGCNNRELAINVLKESLKASFEFVEMMKQELRLGNRSGMMFMAASNLLNSIMQYSEKINAIIESEEKNLYQNKRLDLEQEKLKLLEKKLQLDSRRLDIQQNNLLGSSNQFIKKQNILIMTREDALKQVESSDSPIIINNDELKDQEIIEIENDLENEEKHRTN